MADSLNITIYKLNAFAEIIRDIVSDMPFNEKDDNYLISCWLFCRNTQNKLDALTAQLLTDAKKSVGVVSELTKEIYKHE